MAFALIAAFKTRVLALSGDEIEIESADETLATQCLTDSQNEIESILLSRDIEMTLENITTDWPKCSEMHLDIAIYLYGSRKGWEKLSEEEKPWLYKFDKRKLLEKMRILLSDETVLIEKVLMR